MRKKIIFLDVDGTLTDYENHIPASAAEAIRKARANGHRVYLCTGRSRAEIYDELWAIGLDGMIGGNGCYAEEHGRVLFHQTLSAAQCRAVVDWLRDRERAFYLECSSGLYASPHFREKGDPVIRLYQQRKGKAIERMLAAIGGSIADTIAFGDAIVDVPMLRTCAIGVAMGIFYICIA